MVMKEFVHHIHDSWKTEWSSRRFRRKLIAGFLLNLVVLSFIGPFLEYIEKRNGIALHDWLLGQIQPHNMSLPLIFFIWGSMLLFIYKSLDEPDIVIIFLYSYAFL